MKQSVLGQAIDGVLCGFEVTSITDIIPGPSINETCPESYFLMNNLTKYPLIQTKQVRFPITGYPYWSKVDASKVSQELF